ncbi:MAG: aminotransferase class I/II-fold pyridoxal phosphate-dependent enzyme [Lachnospiraceae bacterium]|nr:aminotransferase class I/II-fold pyridoxal phosphate-dependent enzyme [Lachnospiraceae bacterium]
MMKELNPEVLGIKPSGIRKFFDLVSEMKDAISLGVGEPDFETPWHIREEGIHSLEQGRTFYSSNAGLMELRNAISDKVREEHGISYHAKEEVMVTVGGSEAIDLAMRVILTPGDEVLIPEPCYVSYLPCAKMAYGIPVPIQLEEKDEFRLTPEKLEKAITKKTKLLILPFPNNPTGGIMEERDLEAIVPIILKHNLYVLTDEIYSALSYKGKHHSIIEFPGMRERTVYINGFSKAYAMTGWRLGYACAEERILKQMLKLHQFAIMCAPTTSQYSAVEALRNGDADVRKMRDAYDERRRFLVYHLRKMGLDCFEPYGAFYVFPSIRKFGLSSEEFAEKLLKEEKVAVVPGNAFGASGEGFIRISYAYSLDNLKKAMERMERFIKSLEKSGE